MTITRTAIRRHVDRALVRHDVGRFVAVISDYGNADHDMIAGDLDIGVWLTHGATGEFDITGYGNLRGKVGPSWDAGRVRQYQSLTLSISIVRWWVSLSIRGRRIR